MSKQYVFFWWFKVCFNDSSWILFAESQKKKNGKEQFKAVDDICSAIKEVH